MKRIGFFLPDLSGGGAERMLLTIANGFAEQGLPTDLILMSAEGDYLREISPALRLIDLDTRRATRSVAALRGHLSKSDTGVLISGLDHANICATAATLLCRPRPRLLLSQRNTLSRSQLTRGPLHRHLTRLALRQADLVLAVSEGVRRDLIRHAGLPPARVITTWNPVPTAQIRELAAKPPAPVPGLMRGRPYILGCGRLVAQKGFDDLITAWAALGPRSPDLVILGQGPELARLQALARELGGAGRVHFPGFYENPFALMRGAALFVLSSHYEGLPGVLIQAMACGTPVVATDCDSGPAEILQQGRYGDLVPVGDPTALTKAMAAALRKPKTEGLERRARDFGAGEVIARHIEIVQRSLK